MAITFNPYLTFDGTARAAMEHYRDVFGGELMINTFGEYGAEGPEAEGVMHARLDTAAGFTLMASDTPPGQPAQAGSSVSLSFSGDSSDTDLRRWWDALSEGGTVEMALEKQLWGDEFGQVTDRFGTTWMVNITPAS